ncbi:MAG: hypothetical protein ACI8RD_009322 [Bacillariaceae sp.]|jgi:hypothetical protein
MDLLKKRFSRMGPRFYGIGFDHGLASFCSTHFSFCLADIFSFPSRNKASEFQNRAINHPGDKTKKAKKHILRHFFIITGISYPRQTHDRPSSIKRMAFLYLTRKLIQDETSEL